MSAKGDVVTGKTPKQIALILGIAIATPGIVLFLAGGVQSTILVDELVTENAPSPELAEAESKILLGSILSAIGLTTAIITGTRLRRTRA